MEAKFRAVYAAFIARCPGEDKPVTHRIQLESDAGVADLSKLVQASGRKVTVELRHVSQLVEFDALFKTTRIRAAKPPDDPKIVVLFEAEEQDARTAQLAKMVGANVGVTVRTAQTDFLDTVIDVVPIAAGRA